MDTSAVWVMAWMDLILDSTALSEAACEGDLAELRFRACSIAVQARRHGFGELSHLAAALMERLGFGDDVPASAYAKPVEEIARHVDAIVRERGAV